MTTGVRASAIQRVFWLAHQLGSGATHHTMFWLRLTGNLDVTALRRAYGDLLSQHRVLRVIFEEVDGDLFQRPVEPPASTMIEVANCPSSQAAELAMHSLASRPFAPTTAAPVRAQLLRVGPTEHIFVMALHHLVIDRTSVSVIVDDLARFYAARQAGQPAPTRSVAIDYLDFARGEQAEIARVQPEASTHWKTVLAGGVDRIILPTCPRPARSDSTLGHFERVLSADVRARLSALARRHRVSMYAVLMAGFRAVLARYGNLGPAAIFSPINLRPDRTATVGPYINLVPVVASVSAEETFAGLLATLRRELRAVLRFAAIPAQMITEFGGIGPLERQVALDYTTRGAAKVAFGGLSAEVGSSGAQSAEVDLRIEVDDDFQTLRLRCHYATAALEAPATQRMIEHLATILIAAADDEYRRIRDLPLSAAGEQLSVADIEPTIGPSFLSQFSAMADACPDRLAVVCGEEYLTYGQLSERASQIASAIRSRGYGPNSIVGVCLDRGVNLLAAFLGVMRAGAVYLPLDPLNPVERLHHMVADSGAAIVLTTSDVCCDWPVPAFTMADLPGCSGPTTSPVDCDAAYMIYTSGSTGRPKAAVMEHRNLTHLVQLQRRMFGSALPCRVAQLAACAFDASVWEFVLALAHGGTLVVPRADELTGARLAAFLRTQHIGLATLTPTVMATLPPTTDLPSLAVLVSAGEAARPMQATIWAGGRRFVNAYGPTETTVCAGAHEINTTDLTTIPIGRPGTGTSWCVTDRWARPLPVGVPGELYVGGGGVGRGYPGQPDLTASRFVPDPFGKAGARMYRTGDLVRMNENGAVEFLGRIDNQVKIRGHRVEPEEVQACLAGHPDVADIAVVAVPRPGNTGGEPDLALVAYVVPVEQLDERALRLFGRERLPGFLVPSVFLTMPALPKNVNG
jgi:amino acid adenylation domain-containing protein